MGARCGYESILKIFKVIFFRLKFKKKLHFAFFCSRSAKVSNNFCLTQKCKANFFQLSFKGCDRIQHGFMDKIGV